ncbi:MAG TPA: hypothetical protein VFD90_07550 [Gaiellales bacterium]|jgi:hypothetical protein|nr:hypothetical protein [Gaiellales bacterium]
MTASIDEHRRLLAEALARADADIGELRGRVAHLEAVERDLALCRAECAQLEIDLDGVRGSLSWRATAPLRRAATRARALRGRR